MVSVKYLPVHFFVKFKDAHTPPRSNLDYSFVLRSVLGFNLRSMCCIARSKECKDCSFKNSCAYAFIFETIISQDNSIHAGTDRASHPFNFFNCSKDSFSMNLFGKASDYLPYIYAAFYRAGQKGLFKERVPFKIEDVRAGQRAILIDQENIDTKTAPFDWRYEGGAEGFEGEVLIELKTPLRFKSGGRYSQDFDAKTFMQCLFRRTKNLCSLYGEFYDAPLYDSEKTQAEICEKNIFWKDSVHYSARQKKAMKLGGFCGSFKLRGKLSAFDLAMLDFAKKFSAGKNTNFGLGQMDYWIR